MVSKILRAQSRPAQLQDLPDLGDVDVLQVVSIAYDPWEAKLFLRPHGEGTVSCFLPQRCLKDPRWRNVTSSKTSCLPHTGIPCRSSQCCPRPTLQTQRGHSWFRGQPMRQSSLECRQHTPPLGKWAPHIINMCAFLLFFTI